MRVLTAWSDRTSDRDIVGIWRKSSFSAYNGNCVEVAKFTGTIGVRDSQDPYGAVLDFTPAQWDAFIGKLNREARS